MQIQISPNGVSHQIDDRGRCGTCGKWHPDWPVEEPETSCPHGDGPCRTCDNMWPELPREDEDDPRRSRAW